MHLYLAHHGEAVGSEVDARRPLSPGGYARVRELAASVAAKGIRPAVVWHSGKLRARQTAEEYWRACNALAPLSATRDLQPDDPAVRMRDRLRHEDRDVLIAGHFPHLPRLLTLLLTGRDDSSLGFPINGIVALETHDDGATWAEVWRLPGV